MMGQGAGASSIMHHISSPSREKPQLGAAIVQSPGFFPKPNNTLNDEMYSKFLELAKVDTLDDLVTVDTKALQDANAQMVHESLYGYFNFGPVVDYDYIPDLPGKLLAKNEVSFPSLLLGHTNLDGLLFTPPWIRTTTQLLDHVRKLFPGVPQSVLDLVASEYPVSTQRDPQSALLDVATLLDVGCSSLPWQFTPTNFYTGHRNPMQLFVSRRSFT